MAQQTFKNGKSKDTRDIIIKIEDGFIRFFYNDESINDEFYGFEDYRWHQPRENFPNHMMEKTWFTTEMLDFINSETKNMSIINLQADKDLLEKWVLSYSISQKCFHVEELKHYLIENLKCAISGYKDADYKMVGIYEKQGEADNFSELLLKKEPFNKK